MKDLLEQDLVIEDEVAPGEMKEFALHIAKLPTGSEVDMHAFIYRGKKEGPVLLLSGGLHGDEVNGIEIIRRLMLNDSIMPDAGTVITIPVLNIYGFLNFARELPDGKDANRSFPGTKNGSLASRVAWNLQKKILPLIDYGVDFHTGGGSRSNFAQVRCDFSDHKSLELAKGFAPPFIINSPLIPQSLRNEAKNQGKTIMVFEGGQSLRFDENIIEEAIHGTRRLMVSLGMKEDSGDIKQGWESITLHKTSWIRAEEAGLFHKRIANGQFLEAGEYIGTITDPYNRYEYPIHAPTSGYVIGLNYSPVIYAGDALVHLGSIENGHH
jgi:predicted deacylase